jgi:hypothetical protein
MWCLMCGLRMTLRGTMTAATLAGVIVAGSVNAWAAGPAGVAGSAPDRAAAPAFSETRPPTFNGLADVSCVSASFCMAVGDFLSPTVTTSYPPGIVRPLTEEWNGSSWRVLRNARAVGVLAAVSCTSTSFCMAVGQGAAVAGPSLAETWDGSRWRLVNTPPAGVGVHGGRLLLDRVIAPRG